MSWDVMLQHLPPGIRSLSEIPDDFQPPALGKRADVIARLRAKLPAIDFSDPSWGRLDGDDYSIEFNSGDKDVVDGIMLHLRGSDSALAAVRAACEALGCYALDCSEGDIIRWDESDAGSGFAAWRRFRNRVLDDG
jgi:hypothetical protein